MGSKQSIAGATLFSAQKKSSKFFVLLIFSVYINAQVRPVLKTLSVGPSESTKYYQNVENCSIFSNVTFHFF